MKNKKSSIRNLLLLMSLALPISAHAGYKCEFTSLRHLLGNSHIYTAFPKTVTVKDSVASVVLSDLNVHQIHSSGDFYDYYWLDGKMECKGSSTCFLKGSIRATYVERTNDSEIERGYMMTSKQVKIENSDTQFVSLDDKHLVRVRCNLEQRDSERAMVSDQNSKSEFSDNSGASSSEGKDTVASRAGKIL